MDEDPHEWRQPPAAAWHSLKPEEVFEKLESGPEGLSEQEASARVDLYGPNELPKPKPRSAWRRLAAQFNNVLIYVLLGAGMLTAMLGHWVDAGVIIGVVLINAVIGFVQEGKAERALQAVTDLLSPQAVVLRGGHRMTVAATALVPGDIVALQSGDRVPADLRLFKLKGLRIDEAILTGESQPVEKSIGVVPAETPLGDRQGIAFCGTLVTFGQGVGIVIGTGLGTEIGRISVLLERVETLATPLLQQLAGFGRTLTIAIMAVSAAAFTFGIVVRDFTASEMFLAAVGLAVAAIPEGLPAIITITLAIGVQRMARRNAIIRRLPAVETLGSVTVICSDKTGTLTRNEMTVQNLTLAGQLIDVSGIGYEPRGGFSAEGRDMLLAEQPELLELCKASLLCNDAVLVETNGQWSVQGDPTEGALVVLACKAGLDSGSLMQSFPRTDEVPFESEHQLMATLHHDHSGHGFVYVKGAPEVIISRCNRQRYNGSEHPLDIGYWHRSLDAIGQRGRRPLALAFKPAATGQQTLQISDLDGGLTMLGLVGIMDPPREEAIRAVRDCRAAGIEVKMITGDHVGTACSVGGQLGIGDGKTAYAGERLTQLNEAEFRRAALEADIFARTSPEHKLKLVTALQAEGRVVAMTGDGVNDAPALKRANVGVAMGIKGTEAAKEAAEMVLADDNFSSIAHAIEEGRTVYENIRKAILFILPTNGGEALTIVAAIVLGRMLPVTAAQILWVNMVTAVTLALALAFEPPEPDIMQRPPRRPEEPLLSGFMIWRIVFVSLIMVAVTFGLFLWERLHGASIETARTVAVNALVVLEIFYLLATRVLRDSVFSRDGLFGNRYVLIAILIVIVLQVLFTYSSPMQTIFLSEALSAAAWGRIIFFSALLLFLVELEKWVVRLR